MLNTILSNQVDSLSYCSDENAMSDLLSFGVTVLHLKGDRKSFEQLRTELLAECDYDMERAPVIKDIHQNFSQKRIFKNIELIIKLKEKIEEEILQEVYEKFSFVPSGGLTFELPNLQKYEYIDTDSAFAIPPHVDYKACVEVIAVLLLEGDSQFYVAEDRECNGERYVDAKPLDIILMRGYGFQGIEKRPVHYIKKIQEGKVRTSLGFRMLGTNQEDIMKMERALHSP